MVSNNVFKHARTFRVEYVEGDHTHKGVVTIYCVLPNCQCRCLWFLIETTFKKKDEATGKTISKITSSLSVWDRKADEINFTDSLQYAILVMLIYYKPT